MIVDTKKDIQILLNDISRSDIFITPIFSDLHKHVCNNKLSALYIYSLSSTNEYMILYNHHEKIIDFDLFTELKEYNHTIYTFNKKHFLHIKYYSNIIDLSLLYYLEYNSKPNIEVGETQAHIFFKRQHYHKSYINDIIPIIKHLEQCNIQKELALQIISKSVDTIRSDTFKIYNDIVLYNFYKIEQNGLYVDKSLFRKYFEDKVIYHLNGSNFIYSDYNIYTSTGRPSNSFSGINFAALNKEDGSRKMFTSRFDNGILVELDFSAYHPTMIAELIGYSFPHNISIYEYLGKHYFGKEELTKEELDESKSITFQLCYGGIFEEFEQIPFFKILKDYIYNIWGKFKKNGFIESNLFKRKMTKENLGETNQFKLWNYYIQCHETERNTLIIYNINRILEKYKSKLILYTYDSFLFDMNIEDGKEFLDEIIFNIEDNGKFPIKLKYGCNYHDMIKKEKI